MAGTQNHTIRTATHKDIDAIVTLLPRLADFDIPAGREAADLWMGDRDMLIAWAEGKRDDVAVFVAIDTHGTIIGVSALSLRKEMLSGKPSSHLEVVALASEAEGQGIGRQLVDSAEQYATSHGAQSMTLHVFATNRRARQLYEKMDYDGELIRYSKTLSATDMHKT